MRSSVARIVNVVIAGAFGIAVAITGSAWAHTAIDTTTTAAGAEWPWTIADRTTAAGTAEWPWT